MAQATGQPKWGMRPTTEDRFTLVGVPAEISFERDSSGAIEALVLHQNGLEQRAPRGELPPAPKEMIIPPEVLAEYAGQYPLAPTFVLEVTVKENRVFVQATGQGNIEIFATAEDEFFYKVVDARVSFTRDVSGKVDGLVLHQNGQDMPAKKTE